MTEQKEKKIDIKEEKKEIKKGDTILCVENFNLFYGDNQALKNINFDIKKGEVTALIGPSGCGKSTLLRSFNRMNELIPSVKTNGDIFYNETNINDINPILLRTKIGMVFQSPNPFPMSIYDNVAYGLRCAGVKKKEELTPIVIDSLKKAGLYEEVKDRLKTNAMSLSGGQQQRLCIARAIAMSPDVLLMDEPTSALDPRSTQTIEELILELKENYTIVIVTHNMQQAARISDKTAFFYIGELIEFDETVKIFENPDKKQTEEYITGRFG